EKGVDLVLFVGERRRRVLALDDRLVLFRKVFEFHLIDWLDTKNRLLEKAALDLAQGRISLLERIASLPPGVTHAVPGANPNADVVARPGLALVVRWHRPAIFLSPPKNRAEWTTPSCHRALLLGRQRPTHR